MRATSRTAWNQPRRNTELLHSGGDRRTTPTQSEETATSTGARIVGARRVLAGEP